MYECPNCGGSLKFDIVSQQLKCGYCQTFFDPYSISKEKTADEQELFDVTVFTCPQCGGEIFSTDTSAAEFCSFCGAPAILGSRISKEMRPARIIPFQKTKEDCKKAYSRHMKHAFFAPKELKDEKYIDSFRGIYMPYFAYNVSHQGTVSLKGKRSYRKGDYVYKEKYDIGGNINAYYHSLSYDASSSFSDDISGQIAPFNVKSLKEFTPSLLSGFYADTADVDSGLYKEDAVKLANTESFQKVKKNPAFNGLHVSASNGSAGMNWALCTMCPAPERIMLPVWFMSYRKNGRVAYVTVNGQTGKTAADIPMDVKKYTLCSILLAIPIFILLNFFFTVKPASVLICSALLAAAAVILYFTEILSICQKDHQSNDRGYLSSQKHKVALAANDRDGGKDKGNGSANPSSAISFRELMAYSLLDDKLKIPGFAGSLSALLVSVLILIINPVSDIWYYGGAVISLLGILFTMIAIIKKYNILATRKLPQFDRKGGDDHA